MRIRHCTQLDDVIVLACQNTFNNSWILFCVHVKVGNEKALQVSRHLVVTDLHRMKAAMDKVPHQVENVRIVERKEKIVELLVSYNCSRVMQIQMSLDETDDGKGRRIFKFKHALPMFHCADAIMASDSNDVIVVDKLKRDTQRQALVSIVSTKKQMRGHNKKKGQADQAVAFSSDNLLMFDEQEVHAASHQSVIVPTADSVTIVSVASESNGMHRLCRYELVKMTVDELVDHYLNADDLIMAQCIISKYGLKQTKVYEHRLRLKQFTDANMLEQLLIELIEPLHANVDTFDSQFNDVMRKLMQILLR